MSSSESEKIFDIDNRKCINVHFTQSQWEDVARELLQNRPISAEIFLNMSIFLKEYERGQDEGQ